MEQLATVLVKAGAPILGTIIGGPAGAVAASVLSQLADALGTEPTPEAIAKAAAEQPDKVAEIEQTQGAGLLEAYLRDVQHARDMQVELVKAGTGISWTPTIVTIIVMAAFIGLSVIAVTMVPTPAQREITLYLLGAWHTLAGVAVSFWLGSSASSKDKDATLASMAARVGKGK